MVGYFQSTEVLTVKSPVTKLPPLAGVVVTLAIINVARLEGLILKCLPLIQRLFLDTCT